MGRGRPADPDHAARGGRGSRSHARRPTCPCGPAAGPASVATEDGVALTVEVDGHAGTRLALDQVPGLLHLARPSPRRASSALRPRRDRATRASRGFDGLVDEQRVELERFWSVSDVEIDGDGALQQGVRFNLFSLLQSAGRDGRTSLAAKGLTGEGYEGHYFWDTEIFALPFFAYTQPAIARALLRYRCGIARQGTGAGGRDEPARRPLPVAHDRRATRPRHTSRPEPPSTTSTPTSRTRSAPT